MLKISNFPNLLSQKEVAPLIHKSTAWLERKRWEGGGPPYRKIGRHVLYEEAELLDWVNKHPTLNSTSDTGKGR